MQKINLRVDGMSCGHCEIAIQDAVRKLPGIKKVKADRCKNEITVDYETSLMTLEQIIGTVDSTGYRVIR